MHDFHRTFSDLFTCRKSTTWDRRLYFSSEGRRAEDFYALKNPRTWVLKASTLPLDHRNRSGGRLMPRPSRFTSGKETRCPLWYEENVWRTNTCYSLTVHFLLSLLPVSGRSSNEGKHNIIPKHGSVKYVCFHSGVELCWKYFTACC
jgi:hypothetical protein